MPCDLQSPSEVNLPEVVDLCPKAIACIPLDFKDSLPPKLAARYLRLHRDLGAFLKKVMTLQADLAGESFQKQHWLEALTQPPAHKPLQADLTGLIEVMTAMQHSLPEQPPATLPPEHLDQYYRVLEVHAGLQLECERLQGALQKQGLL